MKQIGVSIVVNAVKGFNADLEVMDIFAKCLEVPFHSIQIYSVSFY